MTDNPMPNLSPADEQLLSSFSAIAAAWRGACTHCSTRDFDLIALSNGHTAAAVTHEVGCPLAEDNIQAAPYDGNLIERLVCEEQAAARLR